MPRPSLSPTPIRLCPFTGPAPSQTPPPFSPAPSQTTPPFSSVPSQTTPSQTTPTFSPIPIGKHPTPSREGGEVLQPPRRPPRPPRTVISEQRSSGITVRSQQRPRTQRRGGGWGARSFAVPPRLEGASRARPPPPARPPLSRTSGRHGPPPPLANPSRRLQLWVTAPPGSAPSPRGSAVEHEKERSPRARFGGGSSKGPLGPLPWWLQRTQSTLRQ